jgi:hypothetical protein
MPSLTPSLVALRLSALYLGADVGAPAAKRKVGGGHQGHYGLASDSSASVWLVAMSRLLRVRDEGIVNNAAASPVGSAVLAALLPAVLRVALVEGGASAELTSVNVITLCNMSASHVAAQRLYDGGLSLPSRLPWSHAKALLVSLRESLAAARQTETGARVAELMLRQPPAPLDAQAQAAVNALATAVEAAMRAKLGGSSSSSNGGGSTGAGSSSASGRSTPPSLPPLPLAAVPPPFAIDPNASLAASVRRLVEARLRRPLQPAEGDRLGAAIDEGLSVLQAGGAEARQRLLATPMLAALVTPGAAQLWASALEATEGDVTSAAAVASALINACSAIAAVLFAAAIGI